MTIEEIKNRIKPIAKTYGIDKISLFGSYAKGEANEESDVDFYIDKEMRIREVLVFTLKRICIYIVIKRSELLDRIDLEHFGLLRSLDIVKVDHVDDVCAFILSPLSIGRISVEIIIKRKLYGTCGLSLFRLPSLLSLFLTNDVKAALNCCGCCSLGSF